MKNINNIGNNSWKVLTTLLLAAGIIIIPGCNSGSNSSAVNASSVSKASGMVVGLKSSFKTKSPLIANQQYVLVASDVSGNILAAQVINCNNFNFCQITLNEMNKSASDSIYLRILNGSGGLIAASSLSLDQYSAGNGTVNSLPITFSEISTGNYILDKMAQAGFAMISGYNGDVEDDLANTMGLADDDHPEIIVPVAAYAAANSLGLGVLETDGILRLWYNLYGVGDGEIDANVSKSVAGDLINYVAEVKSGNALTQLINEQLGIDYSNADIVMQKFAGINSKTIVQNAAGSAVSSKAGGLASIKLTKEATTAAQTTASMILTSFAGAQTPATKEQQQGVKIVKGVLSLAFNALNTAAPGIGSILSFASDSLLDFFYPEEKTNPNAVVVAGLNQLDKSINRFAELYGIQSDKQDNLTLYKTYIASQDLSDNLITSTNIYVNLLKTGADLAERAGIKVNYSNPDFVYASLLDDYVTYSKNKGKAVREIEGLFKNSRNAENIVVLANQISNKDRIADFMEKLNTVRDDKITQLNNAVKDYSQSGYGQFDRIQIDEGYYAKVLYLETLIIKTLDSARNLQLGAAYLKLHSKYADDFDVIYIAEPGVSYVDYATAVDDINKTYETRMKNVVDAFSDKLIKSSAISDARKYYASGLVDALPGQAQPFCNISYWDGVNLETRCPGLGVNGKDIVERINNVKDTCGSNKINLHGTRLYCETQLVEDVTMLSKDKWLYYKADDPWAYLSGASQFYAFVWGKHANQNRIFYGTMDSKNEEDLNTRLDTVSRSSSLAALSPYRSNPIAGGSRFALLSRAEWYKWGFILTDMRDIWVSLGCITSDCKVVTSDRPSSDDSYALQQQEIYFSNGNLVSVGLKYPGTQTGRQTYYLSVVNTGANGRPLPGGDWQKNCNPNTILFQNGVLSAECSNAKWGTQLNPQKSSTILNVDKQCSLGSLVDTNSKGNLVCKTSKG